MRRFRQPTQPPARGLVLAVLLLAAPAAQALSPIELSLVADKTSYPDTEPIKILITAKNISGAEVKSRAGFFARDFHLLIDFTDPDRKKIRARNQLGGPEPTNAPVREDATGALRPATPCERITAGDITQRREDDIRVYYDLLKRGHYTAKVVTSLETFVESVADAAGNLFCFLDDPGRQPFTPLTSNEIAFDIVPAVPVSEAAIEVHARLIAVGSGAQPPVTKADIAGMRIKLIARAAILPDFQPVNHKTYGLIYENVDALQTRITDAQGRASFGLVPQADYVLIGHYDQSADVDFVGKKVDADDPDWATPPILKPLVVVENNKKKKMAGKTSKRKGSALLIIEPEYVEWDSTQEPYPFVFETVGDWSVSTSVSPPEGFVSDFSVLSADVVNETEAVQFLITDVGSRWEETEVTHNVEHKGKTKKIKTKIGVKLSKKLAKEKGLGVYGHTESPGTFTGGKKEKKEKKSK